MNLRELTQLAGLDESTVLTDPSALTKIINQICSKDFPSSVLNITSDTWVAVEVFHNFKIWLNLKDKHVSRNILFAKEWEVNESEFIKGYLTEGDTLIDIGANIGWFSLLGASLTGSTGRVVSFEARPDISHYLKKTIFDNNLQQRITVFNIALGHESGLVSICDVNETNPGASCLGSGSISGRSWPIQMQRLDDLLDLNRVNMIKIDVEGAEHMVFRGAERVLSMRPRPIIVSEINPRQLSSVSGISPDEYIEFMRAHGYDCFLLHDGQPTTKIQSLSHLPNADIYSVVFF